MLFRSIVDVPHARAVAIIAEVSPALAAAFGQPASARTSSMSSS